MHDKIFVTECKNATITTASTDNDIEMKTTPND